VRLQGSDGLKLRSFLSEASSPINTGRLVNFANVQLVDSRPRLHNGLDAFPTINLGPGLNPWISIQPLEVNFGRVGEEHLAVHHPFPLFGPVTLVLYEVGKAVFSDGKQFCLQRLTNELAINFESRKVNLRRFPAHQVGNARNFPRRVFLLKKLRLFRCLGRTCHGPIKP
jgi:hypothetical protein